MAENSIFPDTQTPNGSYSSTKTNTPMKTRTMTTCLLAMLLATAACNKEKLYASYPFICEVDGKKWVLGDRSPLDVYIVGDTNLTIVATANATSVFMGIRDGRGIRTGDYTLDGSAQGNAGRSSGQTTFTTDLSHTGTLTITGLDRKSFKVSGRFSFQAKDPQTGRVVSITNVFFNATYYPG